MGLTMGRPRASIEPDRFVACGTPRQWHAERKRRDTRALRFEARTYVDAYLHPFIAARKQDTKSLFSNIEQRALPVLFHVSGIDVHLIAAGELYAGTKELLLSPISEDAILLESSVASALDKDQIAGGGASAIHDVCDIRVQTTCAVMRTEFLALRANGANLSNFLFLKTPLCDFLLYLVMLEAFQACRHACECGRVCDSLPVLPRTTGPPERIQWRTRRLY
eukprot:IDg1144t1